MTQLSVPRDVEQQAIDLLTGIMHRDTDLQTVKVGTKIPRSSNGKPIGEFIRIMATTPTRETIKTTSWLLTVEGWAATESRAQYLLAIAASILLDSRGLLFYGEQTGGSGNDPHPDYPLYARYSTTIHIRSRNKIIEI